MADVPDEALRASAFDQLPECLLVTEGPEHRAVAANRAFTELFGGLDVVGMTIPEMMAGAENQGVVGYYERAYRTGEVVAGDRFRFQIVTPEGHARETFLDFRVAPRRDAAGVIVGNIGWVADVTALVLRERELTRDAEEMARRYQRASDVVDELQRSLLPPSLPIVPGVDVGASYVVGGAEQAAGGDWFDAVPRPDGTVVLVVGDVVGHGVAASAAMAQLRAVVLDRVVGGEPIEQVVRALDRFATVVPSARSATVCLVDLDPATGRFGYCSAGHPPPLVVDPDGASRFVTPTAEGTLGRDGARRVSTDRLEPGQLLLLYTDGIVERPGTDPAAATVELHRTATAALADQIMPIGSPAAAVDRVTSQVVELLTRSTGSSDDITLLAAQLRPAPERLDVELPAEPAATGRARREARAWIGPERLDRASARALDLVITELVDNVVEHAGDGRPGAVRLTAALSADGLLTLAVTDDGRWKEPLAAPAAHRGLGLVLVHHLAETVAIEPTADGTTVTVQLRPRRPVHTARPIRPIGAVEPVFDVVHQHTTGGAEIMVMGPVDARAAEELGAQLALGVRPGSAALTLDLDEVSVMGSSAIRVVEDARAKAGRAGVDLAIRARPGTPAHHAFTLAAVPLAVRPDEG